MYGSAAKYVSETYKCLWCDWCEPRPPYVYFLMQKMYAGERHLTDAQNTASLATRFQIPSDAVADWNHLNRKFRPELLEKPAPAPAQKIP